jgi:hypothetical protein
MAVSYSHYLLSCFVEVVISQDWRRQSGCPKVKVKLRSCIQQRKVVCV